MSQVAVWPDYPNPRINKFTGKPALCYSCRKPTDRPTMHTVADAILCNKIWIKLSGQTKDKRRNCRKHNEYMYGLGTCTCDIGNEVKLLWRS